MTFPLPGANWTYLHALTRRATTGAAGYALVNGTGTIISWTAPDDGQLHRASLWMMKNVASGETGGKINYSWTLPDGTAAGYTADNGGNSAGLIYMYAQPWNVMVKGGTAVTITQVTALSAGASTLWAEIWAL